MDVYSEFGQIIGPWKWVRHESGWKLLDGRLNVLLTTNLCVDESTRGLIQSVPSLIGRVAELEEDVETWRQNSRRMEE